MEDESIIALFRERSESAVEELGKKYGKLLRKIACNILHSPEDAEECVNDTYVAVWNRIPPEKPEPLCAFVCKIARNISFSRLAYTHAQKRDSNLRVAMEELEDCLCSSSSVEEELDRAELTRAVEGFLENLNAENRVIFMRRYWFCDGYEDIAKRTGLSVKTVSVRLVRMRKKLRAHLSERGMLG